MKSTAEYTHESLLWEGPRPCRPTDFPPYDKTDELDDPDERVTEIIDEAESDRLAKFYGVPRSPWVERATANDLPTFDRHNGAFAFAK